MAIRLSTLEASHQPSSSLSRSTTRLNVGMKAAESVAPASSWKIVSGSRKATQYAPSSGSVPNASAIATERSSPSSREAMKPPATMPAAPAAVRGVSPRRRIRSTRRNISPTGGVEAIASHLPTPMPRRAIRRAVLLANEGLVHRGARFGGCG